LIRVSTSTTIERPVAEVFAYVADHRNQHMWQPGLHEVKVDGDIHSEVRKVMGRRVEHRLELTDHVVNERITHKGKGQGHESEYTRHFLFSGDGKSTKVTMEMDLDTKGILKAGEPVLERILHREITSALEHLKDILEAHSDLGAGMEIFTRHG
jgi:carbon monoxide dehydrogenase subunit G